MKLYLIDIDKLSVICAHPEATPQITSSMASFAENKPNNWYLGDSNDLLKLSGSDLAAIHNSHSENKVKKFDSKAMAVARIDRLVDEGAVKIYQVLPPCKPEEAEKSFKKKERKAQRKTAKRIAKKDAAKKQAEKIREAGTYKGNRTTRSYFLEFWPSFEKMKNKEKAIEQCAEKVAEASGMELFRCKRRIKLFLGVV